MTESEGGQETSKDFSIPVVVTELTEAEMDAIYDNPASLKADGMTPDEAVLKYMAVGGSIGTEADRRRRRRGVTSAELEDAIAKRHSLLGAVVDELQLSVSQQALTAALAGRVLTAMASNVGGGNPVPVKPASAALAANALKQLAGSGQVQQSDMLSFAVVVNNAIASLYGDTANAAYRQSHTPVLAPVALPTLTGGAIAGLGSTAEQQQSVAILLTALEATVKPFLDAAAAAPGSPVLIQVSNLDPNAAASKAEFDYTGGRASCDSVAGSFEVDGGGDVAVTVPWERLGCSASGTGSVADFSVYRFDKDPHRWFANAPTSSVVSFASAAAGARKRQARDVTQCYTIAFAQDEKVDEKRAYSVVHRLSPHTTLVLKFDRTATARQQAVQMIVEPFTVVKPDKAATKVQAAVTGHLHVQTGVDDVVSPLDAARFDYSFGMDSNRVLPADPATDISDPDHVVQIVPSDHANHACSDAKTTADPFTGGTAKYVLALETSSEDVVDVLVRIWHEEYVGRPRLPRSCAVPRTPRQLCL